MKAKLGHYSSVVGLSIIISKDSGEVEGQLSLHGFNLDRTGIEAKGKILTDAINKGLEDIQGVEEAAVIVNGQNITVPSPVGYRKLLRTACRAKAIPDERPFYSVTYRNGPSVNQEGILCDGESLYVKNGMIFNAYITGDA